MSKVGDETSGVVGGTLDVSRDTTVDPPSDVLDEAMARRHQASARGRAAALRNQGVKQAHGPPGKK
jgi:hypothetical protein